MNLKLTVPFAALATAGALAGIGLGDDGHARTLTAKLDSRHEVPAAKGARTARGAFTATVSGRSLTWKLTFVRLSGKAAAAHIHLGKPGVAGPVAVPLCGPCASGVHGTVMVSSKVRDALRAGRTYVNVHTTRNPAGEIRGQVEGGDDDAGTTTSPTTTEGSGGGYGGGYGAYG